MFFDRTSPTRRRHQEGGFTLIELLVVIVILGIISAVVVFSVGGIGDRGEAAALETDADTIRTAQEAYCAEEGEYAASTGELADEGFLVEPSTLNEIGSTSDGACQAEGLGFEITCYAEEPGCGAGGTVPISTLNVPVTGPQLNQYTRPYLAKDPTDPQRLAVAYGAGSVCYLGVSNDGGSTWSETAVMGPSGTVLPFPGVDNPATTGVDESLFEKCIRPAAAYDAGGTLYYAGGLSYSTFPSPGTIYVTSSTDQGQTFPGGLRQASTGPSDQDVVLAAGPTGQVQVAWQANKPSTHVRTSSSADSGSTFTPSVQVNSDGSGGSRPNIAVASDGSVAIVYVDGKEWATSAGAFPLRAKVATSSNGATFGSPVLAMNLDSCGPPFSCQSNAQGHPTFNPYASIAVDSSGKLFVAGAGLVEGTPTGNMFRLSFGSSSNGGTTWTAPQEIGVPPGREVDHQLVPSVSVAPNGRVDVAYYNLEQPSGLENTYVISSTDSGSTFSAPERVSSVATDTAVGPQRNTPYTVGSLAASTDQDVLVAWADGRRTTAINGKSDIYFGKIPRP